jgi:hypothetical protein
MNWRLPKFGETKTEKNPRDLVADRERERLWEPDLQSKTCLKVWRRLLLNPAR